MERHPYIESIRRETAAFTDRKVKAGQYSRNFIGVELFTTRRANEWMKQQYGKPAVRMLFGSFWFEHELCIMFADTNLGKSILAVQIAANLTTATTYEPFYNKCDEGLPVLYIDFELSAKQFEARYSHPQYGSHLFSDLFYRAEFNPGADDPVLYTTYEKYIEDSIINAIKVTEARVLIIDNITYMRRGTEKASDAQPLMKTLKALKIKFNISVLVLAHTPKRDNRKPLTINDLQGSKMLINFADSAFAIGQSHLDPNLRYLKQIKQRNQQEQYGEDNVVLIRPEKQLSFLGYKFEGYAAEYEHLHPQSPQRQAHIQQIRQLHRQGMSLRDMALQLGMHFSAVHRVVKKIKAEEKEGEAAPVV
ncbi:AAA family ATPase [Mucilaginibacter flavus]|uniref:AAA family ATPase n=1 Tax=Mucilaginibacter flavus TaxID=931504 RepID=UPI0025B39FD9|nr:AAA family ATPase [Mucilaginibacter flavus]MDN3581366.1 AAA family ATPase [Mucilaginibacter flavus]